MKARVAYVAWQDKKLVTLLTTAYHPRLRSFCQRKQIDGQKKTFICPLAINEYTKRMGGVDRFDQLKGFCHTGRRSRKWWMRIFYFTLDVALVNSFILYSTNTRVHNPKKMLEFRKELARQLVNNFTSKKRPVSALPNYSFKRPKASDNRQKIMGVPNEIRYNNVGSHMPLNWSLIVDAGFAAPKLIMCAQQSNVKSVKFLYVWSLVLNCFINSNCN